MNGKKTLATALAASALALSLAGCASGYTGQGGELSLHLPEEYAIQYNVHEEYGIGSDYTQTMRKCREGYYFAFSNTGEQYVFEDVGGGRYLQYNYNRGVGGFIAPTSTPVDGNVVAGYASRVTPNLELYSFAKNYLNYTGDDIVQGVSCRHYTVDAEGTTWGRVSGEFWIDPATGICMKGSFTYQQAVGSAGIKRVECTLWQTSGVTLPDYK